ncbi:hypothetical protein LOK49_LG14G01481 [Camellia lanceoleosa]|uniref:Uncharacterized protein n=1 Tax=Camellia lanceoleosa TaxID=1840588 RepID=A0ACC0FFL0_9ERIC|nr:hypothetical protein LOK49_LG14G01481 [Camellia lanceoleosa]
MDMAVCNSCNPTLRSHIFLCSFFFSYFVIALYYFPLHANALSFNITNINQMFSDVNTIGAASFSNDSIQITPNKVTKAGQATYKDPFHLWDKAFGTLMDFNTYFLFVVDSEGNSIFADGLTFFLIPHDDPISYNLGGCMGLPITETDPPTWTSFVAVEFDTSQNRWDTSKTHVGININSLTSNKTAKWDPNITYGKENEAWISYNSSSKNLSVVFTGYVNNEKITNSLSFLVDLRDYLTEWVRIGFSAATASYSEKHIIKSWSFN